MTFKYAEAEIEMSFKDAGLQRGLDGIAHSLSNVTSHAGHATSALDRITGAGAAIGSGFAMGGGVGAGLAAVGALAPLAIEGIKELYEYWKEANESAKVHMQYTSGVTEAYKQMAAAVKTAASATKEGQGAWRDAMWPNAANRNLHAAARNQGRGFGLEDAERARLDEADMKLAEEENRLAEAIKKQRQQAEHPDLIAKNEHALFVAREGRKRIEERRDEGDQADMFIQNMMAQEAQARREDKQRLDDLVKNQQQRQTARESQQRQDVMRGGEDERAGQWLVAEHDRIAKEMQGDVALSKFRAFQGNADDAWKHIQGGINQGVADQATKRLEAANKRLEEIRDQAKEFNVNIQKLDLKARAG